MDNYYSSGQYRKDFDAKMAQIDARNEQRRLEEIRLNQEREKTKRLELLAKLAAKIACAVIARQITR